MRHLFVTQDYGPDLGGMARRHVEVCRHLAPDAVEVSTVAASDGGRFDSGESYQVHRQRFAFSQANRVGNRIRWARDLASLARGFDVIHAGNIRASGYAAWWAARRARIPYLVYVNGGDLLREKRKAASFARRLGARRIFSAAAGIVATSRWVGELSAEVMDVVGVRRPPPIRAFDLGTDPAWFHPRADTGSLRARWKIGTAPAILTVARLVRHKGQDVGIRALAALKDEVPELRYVLVGEGPEQARLQQLAADLGLASHVIFAGVLSDSELPEAYSTATVYLGASRVDRDVDVEGFGISFIEAAACALPSVAGDSGGIRSAVRDGETGFVVPPTDVAAVAGAVGVLLRDESLRRRMGGAGRTAVERHYNWDRVARDTRQFARDVTRK
ncbi:MAG TPA: glycosyltransferase family 4 protein [Gemmatimonadaceae bacterium]|nr:glycosyltransferase family 4 protein [Gemmatimonadaceae bacterium]